MPHGKSFPDWMYHPVLPLLHALVIAPSQIVHEGSRGASVGQKPALLAHLWGLSWLVSYDWPQSGS